MKVKRPDSLINSALALLSTLPAAPSPKALSEASGFLSGKPLSRLTRSGSEADRLFFRCLTALAQGGSDFDASSLTKLHAYLFDSLRADAGKLRTAAVELDGSSFADPSLIGGSLKRLLGKLTDIGEGSKEDFAMQLTYYFNELFLLCPFRWGSPLTIGIFFSQFAVKRGFRLDFSKCGGARLIDGLKRAFLTDEKTDLFVCLTDAVGYADIESGGENIEVVDATQIKRELKHDVRAKTLVKRGDRKAEKPKKEDKPRGIKKEDKPRKEAKPRPPERKKPEPATPKRKSESKAVAISKVKDEAAAAKAAIAAEMQAAKAAIAAEAEAARAAIEAEKAAARAEMEAKAKEAEKKSAAKKTATKAADKSSRGKNSLKKALARTVLLFEDIPEFGGENDGFTLAPEKANPLLLPSAAHEENNVQTDEIKAANSEPTAASEPTEKTETAVLPKLAPIKKIERKAAKEKDTAKEAEVGSAVADENKPEEKPVKHKAERKKAAPPPREEETPTEESKTGEASVPEEASVSDVPSDEDALAQKVAEMSELPSGVLRKAAVIKEKIEELQKELKQVLSTKNDKK